MLKQKTLLEYAKSFQCCIFDFDGTLLDSNEIKCKSCLYTLLSIGLERSKAQAIGKEFIFHSGEQRETKFFEMLPSKLVDKALGTDRSILRKLQRARMGFWHNAAPPYGYKIEDKKLMRM